MLRAREHIRSPTGSMIAPCASEKMPHGGGTNLTFGASARIAIVGGGASGVAAARALRRLGYRRVTLFEREPQVGGKCCTMVYGGRSYELGAALLTPMYHHVRALMREVGVRATAQAGAIRALRPRRWPQLAAGGLRFWRELTRHRRILRPGFAGLSDNLALPFDDWCRTTRCEEMQAFLEPLVTGFGYGFLRELPAAYVLKYATLFGVPVFEILGDGYGGLLSKVAASLEPVDIRVGARVTGVERHLAGVTVRTSEGPSEFDALIVACPLDEALSFLDATAREVELFERIRYEPYFVIGAMVDGPLPRERYLFLRPNLARESIGRPMFAYRRWASADTVFFYGFAREADWESAARCDVASSVEQLGGHVRDVVVARKWRYFPHVQTDDIASGYYRKLEGLQGARRTYYCGEIVAFGAVETVVEYAHALVRDHFGPVTSSLSGERAPPRFGTSHRRRRVRPP